MYKAMYKVAPYGTTGVKTGIVRATFWIDGGITTNEREAARSRMQPPIISGYLSTEERLERSPNVPVIQFLERDRYSGNGKRATVSPTQFGGSLKVVVRGSFTGDLSNLFDVEAFNRFLLTGKLKRSE